MTTFTWHSAQQRPGWLFQLLEKHPSGGRLSRWWQWAVMSLGCLAGCTTTNKAHEIVAIPFRITEGILLHTKDCIEESWEYTRAPFTSESPSCTDTGVVAESITGDMLPYSEPLPGAAEEIAPIPMNDAPNAVPPSASASRSLPAVTVTADLSSNATKSQPVKPKTATAALSVKPTIAQTVSVAPNQLSLADAPRKLASLPAPPVIRAPPSAAVPAAFSPPPPPASAAARAPEPLHAQTVSASRPIPPTANLPANIKWCQVRLRNVSQQTIAQVSVVITSPDNTELVVSNSGPVLPIHSNRMDFSAIPQIAPQEEVIVTVGISASDEQSHRLHVQVRDAQGGSNQQIQARWKVTIEPIDKP